MEAINPWLALGPPIFIFTVTAVKDGIENYRRHKSDEEINGSLCKVYAEGGVFALRKWKQIRVGDIIELNLNDVIPGNCFIKIN